MVPVGVRECGGPGSVLRVLPWYWSPGSLQDTHYQYRYQWKSTSSKKIPIPEYPYPRVYRVLVGLDWWEGKVRYQW